MPADEHCFYFISTLIRADGRDVDAELTGGGCGGGRGSEGGKWNGNNAGDWRWCCDGIVFVLVTSRWQGREREMAKNAVRGKEKKRDWREGW